MSNSKKLLKELVTLALKRVLREQDEKDLFATPTVGFETLKPDPNGLIHWFSFSNPRELPLMRLLNHIRSLNIQYKGPKRDITPEGNVEYKFYNINKADVGKILSNLPEGIKYRSQPTSSTPVVNVKFNRMNSRRQAEPTRINTDQENNAYSDWKRDKLKPLPRMDKSQAPLPPGVSSKTRQAELDSALSAPPGEYTKPLFSGAKTTSEPVATPRPKGFDLDQELAAIYRDKK